MLVLVANLGSTSFKYKLFEMDEERWVASGSAERIGQGSQGVARLEAAGAPPQRAQETTVLADHGAAIRFHLAWLEKLGVVEEIARVGAVGFKAVHGGPIGGAVRVDEEVLATMERFTALAPAHNPPYIAAMRYFAQVLPGVPQVAAFETAFHATIPEPRRIFGIPWEWTQDLGIRRYGFHGASHRYIATRMAELDPQARRLISLHLGGSSSLCAIREGCSVATSMATTPQSGLFHNNRVGDFDVFAILALVASGLDLETVFSQLSKAGGLLGISGLSGDWRDLEAAAAEGHVRARLAMESFAEGCRHYLGAYLAVLGGAEAICFTGGIGQHAVGLREAVCRDMAFAGIRLDAEKNSAAPPDGESRVDAEGSRTRIWVLPTNEELIVARQTVEVLAKAA